MKYTYNSINIDPVKESENIITHLRDVAKTNLKKRGAVVGISGGIDSSVVLALCVKAFGPEKVTGIMMPETDSSPESVYLAQKLADTFGVNTVIEDLSAALSGFDCYERRDEAIRRIFPEYDSSYKMKILLPKNNAEANRLNLFNILIVSPDGVEKTERLPIKEYLQIVAASNLKQRSRMSMLYYHAELRNYAVVGTGNKNEHEQGFFVKYGDGGADIKPIAHLFKTQVYQLAKYLGIPEEIQNRVPTTDTYSAEQTQEEFFFQLPFDVLDRVWFGMEMGVAKEEIAEVLKLPVKRVEVIQNKIIQKKRGTEYLRSAPLEFSLKTV